MPSKTGEQFLAAIGSEKICNLDNVEPIKQALRYEMALGGLRAQNLPNEHEKMIILNHIVKYFGGHTAEEIRLAFEKAVNGELGLKSEDVTCYENFSVLYFSRIMTAYREWSAEQYNLLVKEEPPRQVILTDEQLDDLHRYDVEMFYQRCLNGRIPEKTPDYFKRILVDDGLMKQEDNLVAFFVNRLNAGSKTIYVNQENK